MGLMVRFGQSYQTHPTLMQKLLIACLLMIAAAPLSSAGPARKVQFRTLCIERAEEVDKVVIPGSGKKAKPQEVVLYTDLSPVIDGVFGTDEAVFYGEKTGANGKVERIPIGKAKLGKSARQLFVFTPTAHAEGELPEGELAAGTSAEGKLAYRVLAFDDDEKSFPMGRVRAINLAPVAVRYALSEAEQIEVAAGESAQLPHPSEVNDYNLYPVTVEYKNDDGEWVVGSNTNWKSSEKKREIAVTNFSVGDKLLTVRLYGDIPPWRK
jgi:hypothetical protein